MDLRLKYGRQTVSVSLDDDARVAVVQPQPTEAPPAEPLIRQALERPIASPPLSEVVGGRKNISLIVSDKTRATQTAVFLPILLETLNRAGIPDERITLLLATGSHFGHSPEEMDRVLGPGVRSRLRVVDHDAHDARAHVRIGKTSRGTPVDLDRHVVESDCVILTGSISFHYFAGFGGGRKALLPGVASYESILSNHRLMVLDGNRDDPLHPLCANGVLDGNPIHEDMMEASRLAKPDFLLNTILTPDGRIASVVSGDPWQAHQVGTMRVRSIYGVSGERKAKLVIASCGGHPKDINFIQAHKSLHHAFDLVDEGGVLILIAECSQGIGSDDFMAWFSALDLRSVAARLKAEFTVNAHTAYVAMRKALTRKILMVTGLPRQTVRSMGMEPVESAGEAVERARGILGRLEDVIVLPMASVTVPLPAWRPAEGGGA